MSGYSALLVREFHFGSCPADDAAAADAAAAAANDDDDADDDADGGGEEEEEECGDTEGELTPPCFIRVVTSGTCMIVGDDERLWPAPLVPSAWSVRRPVRSGVSTS